MLGIKDTDKQWNKTVALIDGANLFATAKNLGFDIDFKLLRNELKKGCNLIRIYYYTALLEQEDRIVLRPLVDWLNYNGYTLVTKPAKVITNREGIQRVKGNMDVEIAVDAVQLAFSPIINITDMILFTGDGDFRYLVEQLQKTAIRVTVVSSIKTPTAMIADDLRKQCDEFIELDDWRDRLAKPHISASSYAMTEDEEKRMDEEKIG